MQPLSSRRPITGRRGTRHLATRLFRCRYLSRHYAFITESVISNSHRPTPRDKTISSRRDFLKHGSGVALSVCPVCFSNITAVIWTYAQNDSSAVALDSADRKGTFRSFTAGNSCKNSSLHFCVSV